MPEISITASSTPITEGHSATPTISAIPTPGVPITVGVTISVTTRFASTTPASQQVNLSTGTESLPVTTASDSADDTIAATINSGSGYAVSSTAGSALIVVQDDDLVPQPNPIVPLGQCQEQEQQQIVPNQRQFVKSCVSDSLLARVQTYYDMNKQKPPNYGRYWERALITFGDIQDSELLAFAAAIDNEAIWAG